MPSMLVLQHGRVTGSKMKPIEIEFLADPRKGWAWWAFGFVAIALVCVTIWKVQEYRQASELLESEIATLKASIASRAVAVVPTDRRKLESKRAIAKLLQQDLGTMFAAVESLRLPDVRLKNLSFEASSNAIRIEYELNSMTQVDLAPEKRTA